MLVLGEARAAALMRHSFSDALQLAARGEVGVVHPELTHVCGPLRYCLEPEDFSPSSLTVVPLWEGNSSVTGFVESVEGTLRFVRYEVEYPDDVVSLGESEFELWVALFRRDVDEEFAEDVAAALGLPGAARVLSMAYAD